jgi:GGDEF domain-containing protein
VLHGVNGVLVLRWLGLILYFVASCGFAQTNTQTPIVRLDAAALAQAYPAPLDVAIGLGAALTVQEVAALPRERFVPFAARTAQSISIDQPLWLRMQIDAGQAKTSAWMLEIPTVIVDRYEVYQRDASGVWQMAAAGDRVAHAQWPVNSLRPSFPLSVSGPGVQDVFIRVEHQLAATIQPVIVDAALAKRRDAFNILWAGAVAGLMAALLMICLQMTHSYRDWTYLWYAAYLLATMMTTFAYSGVGQQFLWPMASKFASDAVVCFILAAFSFNLLFVSAMFGKWLTRHYRWITMLLITACVSYTALTLMIEEYARIATVAVWIIASSSAFILFTAVQAWRKGVPYSGYWLLVYVPYMLSITLTSLESAGQISLPWLPVNTPMIACMAEAVAMMFCLNAYSRESHAQAVREQVAAQRDPLTGFLNESRFISLASQAWFKADGKSRDVSLAYALVESKEQGLSIVQAEALMLRSVRMVRTAMRESDGVGRIGRNVLGIVMPDMKPGDALNANLSRLIALGLMLDPHESAAQALKFTVAVSSKRINNEDFSVIDKKLRSLLAKDTEDRPRAIRFLEPDL